MGVCMSRFGDAQSAGPAPISHRSYSFNNTESLKKFLHLQSALKSENPSPRTSLGVLHSGELFSLPPSDPEYRSSFAVSPLPQTSERARRVSAGRTTKKRVRPADHDAAAHQRLIDAITRLERLHDGKQQTRSSNIAKQSLSRSRNVRHYQLQLQKLESPRIPLASTRLTNFLREVESYVSLTEAPDEATRPVPKTVSSLVRGRRVCDETDSDDMFTVFEASDRSSGDGEARRQRSSTSLHQLVQSASQVGVHEDSSATKSLKCRLRSTSPLNTNIDLEDPCIESMREESGEEAAAAAMDMTVAVAILKTSPSPVIRRAPSPSRMRALKGFRRRLSRSLDSRESGADFDDLLRSTAAPACAASRLSNCTTTTSAQAAFIGSKSTQENMMLLPVTSSIPGMKLEQAGCDEMFEASCTVEVLDTSTLELATSEVQPSPNAVIMLVEDQTPTTSSESVLSELLSMDAFLDEDQSSSTSLASAQSSFRDSPFAVIARSCEESFSSECSSESVSPSPRSSCPSETHDFHHIPHPEFEDFQKILSKASNSLSSSWLRRENKLGLDV